MVLLLLDRGATVDWTADASERTPFFVACAEGHADIATLLLRRGADVDSVTSYGWAPLHAACEQGHFEVARLCLASGADIHRRTTYSGLTASSVARQEGYTTAAAWLVRIESSTWTRHLSEPRYALVILRAISARGRARRERALFGEEKLLDFLFPSDQTPPQASKRTTRVPRLPDDLFPLVARYYCGGLWAEEETALAAEVAARRESDAAGEGDDAQGY